MKAKILGVVVLFLMGMMSVLAQNKTEKFKVYGNCGMCEQRIEKAASKVEGVTAVDWNKKTKMIEVSFDQKKTDVKKIHLAISKAGYDTDKRKAASNDYMGLPGCCQYDRPK